MHQHRQTSTEQARRPADALAHSNQKYGRNVNVVLCRCQTLEQFGKCFRRTVISDVYVVPTSDETRYASDSTSFTVALRIVVSYHTILLLKNLSHQPCKQA
jgi:hypothetical protein